MSHQLQDGRVERATSQWWRSPVVAACLRVLALLGFAGIAWLVAGASMAHADAGSTPVSGAAPVLAAAGSTAAPATSILGATAAPVTRPLATAAAPIAPLAAVAVSPLKGNTGGALAPATDPAAEAPVVNGTAVPSSTPAHGSVASQAIPVGDRQGRPSPVLSGSAALLDPLSMTQDIAASLGVEKVVAPLTSAVRPLTDTARPVTEGVTSVLTVLPKFNRPLQPILPVDASSSWVGRQPTPATAETSTAPLQAVQPVIATGPTAGAGHAVESWTASFVAIATDSSDLASGPAVGASNSAPTLPVPVPGPFPGMPGAALQSGSAAGSSMTQHEGSTGAIGTSGLAARMLASRATAVTEKTGVTLVRAEDPSVSPD